MKRSVTLFLVLSLILSCMTMQVWAQDLTEEVPTVSETTAETTPVEETIPVLVEETISSEAMNAEAASGTPDGTPPVLNNLTISATTVSYPNTIEVIADASDDISGVNSIYVSFYCEELGESISTGFSKTYWDENTFEQVPYPDGLFHGTLKADQYQESGTFVLRRIHVGDAAGNYTYYGPYEENPIPENLKSMQITVRNSDADIITSVSNSDFTETVQSAENDSYIVADYSGKATLSEDVFTAISGTDKTLDLVSEGVTWRFEGSDIVNEAKPVDLQVEIYPVEDEKTSAGAEIQEGVADNPAVVMKFAENGQLPGKATIQVKVDYALQQYLKQDQFLTVYYYNNQTGELELVAENLSLNEESYVEFPITHCSYYILTPFSLTGSQTRPMYRLYNPYTLEHLLTANAAERNLLVSAGWSLDGTAWNSPNEGALVYRLYNPYDDWHTYTMNQEEIDMLVPLGWKLDGVVCRSATQETGKPVYRLFNPYEQKNYHLLTASEEEREFLMELGWKLDGVAWYCLAD